MKRDVDLARTILFAIEKDKRATGHGFICLNIDGYSKEEVSYHVNLLYEARLIDTRFEYRNKRISKLGLQSRSVIAAIGIVRI